MFDCFLKDVENVRRHLEHVLRRRINLQCHYRRHVLLEDCYRRIAFTHLNNLSRRKSV